MHALVFMAHYLPTSVILLHGYVRKNSAADCCDDKVKKDAQPF